MVNKMQNNLSDIENITASPSRFFNRELSWLEFNQRVLDEALNDKNPLLERLRFLSISAANLDEFIMVRIAGLRDQVANGIEKISADGLSPKEQLVKIYESKSLLIERQQDAWVELQKLLAVEGIHVLPANIMTADDKKWLNKYFLENIFPALTPIAVDPAHPFPFLPNLSLAQLFELENTKTGASQIVIIPLPSSLPRFIEIQNKNERFILMGEAIKESINILFPNFKLKDTAIFRIIRDSDLEVEEEAGDLMRGFEKAVKKRRRGEVIHVVTQAPVSQNMLKFFTEQMPVSLDDIIEVTDLVGMDSLSELYKCDRPNLKFPAYQERFPERIADFNGDCFAAIKEKDIIVHHPFESFDVVVQFLRQASIDPNVVSIKQTLYRTGHDSPIVSALIAAAESGKSVTALVELKARFDEEANIYLARKMERAGVHVVYGFVELKTHAKMSLVTRREQDRLRSYAHFGTGNYHPVTAKIYTDLSYFTSHEGLCHDAARLFNFVTGYSEVDEFDYLLAAPINLRNSILEMIDDEIAHAKAGNHGCIWAKMNALVDRKTIDKLYEASSHGVKINLVVRGICRLRPQVKGLSENITVKSIIGRFLEHSRIYCFGNGKKLPSNNAKVFISSADWMNRNFDWRVEVMVPILNPTVHKQVLDQIMVANLRDNSQSWLLQSDGSYQRLPIPSKGDVLSAHEYFMKNPSLSGRGTALKKTKKRKLHVIKNKKHGN